MTRTHRLVILAAALLLLPNCDKLVPNDQTDDTVTPRDMADMAADLGPDAVADMVADSTPDLGPDTQMPDGQTGDMTSDMSDLVIPPETMLPVGSEEVVTDAGLVDVTSFDFNRDGYADLVGVDANGDLVVSALDPSQGKTAPFAFATPATKDLGAFTAKLVVTGDFNGDDFDDIAVWDPEAGAVRLAVNTGAAFDNPLVAFDNPLVAFDNPLVAFDNPLVAFDNPLVASSGSWASGDYDGDGLDDLAFAVGSKGVSVAWMDGADPMATMDPVATSLASPGGLSDFDNPLVAVPNQAASADIDNDGDAELMVGYDLTDNANFDGIALFDGDGARAFDNPLVAFDNPLVASSGGTMMGVDKGLSSMSAGDMNGDNAADLAWSSSVSGGGVAVGAWVTSSFDNPLVAATNGPQTTAFAGGSAENLESGRLLLDQAMGVGAGGTDGLALLNAEGHLLIPGLNGETYAIPIAPGGILLAAVELAGAGALGLAVDLNGDGFAEFLAAAATGFGIDYQDTLMGTDFVATDGSTTPLCEIAAPFCDQGSLGLCELARDTCGTCTVGEDFAAAYPGVDFDLTVESSELSCDGLDNDCDGLVDVLGETSVALGATAAPVDFHVVDLDGDPLFVYGTSADATIHWEHADAAATSGTLPGAFDANVDLKVVSNGPRVAALVSDGSGGLQVVGLDGSYMPSVAGSLGAQDPDQTFPAIVDGSPGAIYLDPMGTLVLDDFSFPTTLQSQLSTPALRAAFADALGGIALASEEAMGSTTFEFAYLDFFGMQTAGTLLIGPFAGAASDVVATGGGDTICLAFVDNTTTPSRLTTAYIDYIPVYGEFIEVFADYSDASLAIGDAVDDTLVVTQPTPGGSCRVTWLSSQATSPVSYVQSELFFDKSGHLGERTLGPVAFGGTSATLSGGSIGGFAALAYVDPTDFTRVGFRAVCDELDQGEICGDFVDNDGDMLDDCMDPDCAGDFHCVSFEICDDGMDNDGDGFTDCMDSKCVGHPACGGSTEFDCGNGSDDDGDGDTDCADIDCSQDPLCASGFEYHCSNLVDDDGDGLNDCSDPDCQFEAVCGGLETFCDDGFDDDFDGDVDCVDIDCSQDAACAGGFESDCGNSADDDGDSLQDCADGDCALDPLCIAGEINCIDGIDDDLDSLVDCADSDCFGFPGCDVIEFSCEDLVDNDGDGDTDCADSECIGDPACP